MWVLTNFAKDQEEDFEKYKLLCRFMNPEAAKKLWDTPQADEEVVHEETSTDEFLKEVQEHTTQKLTANDIAQANTILEADILPDIDKIETVE